VQVNVSARHGQLSAPDQELIREKAEKVRRIFDRINAIQVTVDFHRQDKPHVEINVSAEHTEDFVATAEATTVISALDAALQKIEQQVRKHKEKLTGHKGTSAKPH
jgi:putative sigma-54 modulation protein